MNEGRTGHPGQPEGGNSIVRSTNDSNKGSPGLGWGTKFWALSRQRLQAEFKKGF